jgi:hypothetical protein
MQIGYSSRLPYDECAYNDRLDESVSPMKHQLDVNQIDNCNKCLSVYGPRSSYRGAGVSSAVGFGPAAAQDLVDLESILSNRNLKMSKCRRDGVNNIDATKFKTENLPQCNNLLDPMASRLMFPASTFRDMSVNRFFDTHQDAQAPIFWNFAIDTKLEAKDNYFVRIPKPKQDKAQP